MEGRNTAFKMRPWKGGRLACALVALLFAWGACVPVHAFAKGEDSIALNEGEKAYFSEIGTLRVLTLSAWQPYSFQGEGLAVDILEKLCAATGVRLQAVEAESYKDAMSRLAGGEADISAVQVGNLGEGGGFVPYLRAPVQVVLHKDAQPYESAEITAALLDGVDYLDMGRYEQVKTASFASVKDCLYAVRNRQVDFFACDLYLISPFMSRLGGMDLTIENVPQHEVEIGFGLAPGADKRLASALEKTVDTYSTADLSSKLMLHERKNQPESGIVSFVYQNPFELLCALASLFFVAVIALLVYTRTRVGQHQELRGYEESYRVLADTFGQAGMEYDFLKDRLTVFGAQHDKLDLPRTVERLHEALEQRALRISLTPESFDALLENNAPGRSYEAELQCGMKEGGWNWFRMIYVVVCTSESHRRPIRLMGCLVNIEAEYQERERLLRIGRIDPLTGLLNRVAAEAQIMAALAETEAPSLLLFMDIDHFKLFNDQHGHFCGDAVLSALGEAAHETFPMDSVLCRWGGDEFLFFLNGAGERPGGAAPLIQTLQDKMKAFSYKNESMPVSLSIGGTVTERGMSFEALVQRADDALYAVKKEGRGDFKLAAADEPGPQGKDERDEANA